MLVDPGALIETLRVLVDPHQIPAQLAAQATWEAAKWAATALWKARPEGNVFDALWQHTVEEADAPWSQFLRPRIRDIRGAFEEGRVASIEDFATLLQDVGADPDCAEDVLACLEEHLRTALLEAARSDARAFQPAVVDELVRLGWVLEEEFRNIRLTLAHDVAQIKGDVREIKDGLAHRPDEMRPGPIAPPHEFTDEEIALLNRVQDALQSTPDLIDKGQLDQAQKQLTVCRHDVILLLHRARQADAPDHQRLPLLGLLARTDIQLGTVAFEAYQYRVAAEVYQRAVDHARESQDEELALVGVYQTGVALAHAGLWRLSEPWFREALEMQADLLSARANLALVLNELGQKREALQAIERSCANMADWQSAIRAHSGLMWRWP